MSTRTRSVQPEITSGHQVFYGLDIPPTRYLRNTHSDRNPRFANHIVRNEKSEWKEPSRFQADAFMHHAGLGGGRFAKRRRTPSALQRTGGACAGRGGGLGAEAGGGAEAGAVCVGGSEFL